MKLPPPRFVPATKAELRAEIAELRNIGAQMSNVFFNLAQGTRHTDLGRMVSGADLESMGNLRVQWDAIQRREGNRRETNG